ncbi:hypothetical protein RSJ42_16995 [Methanosarcina hadiensis]|uniref:hypothetical protein n=1 Tax=Methanosarcina hadiensis TaxID=3078083 RepID=UPI0039778483
MSRKSLLESESAAAIAIAAVLLLGLAFTIISVVKLNYAPEWKIDAERDYSYDAWSNMEDVKNRVDLFTRFMDSNSNYSGYGLSATVPFSMGGGDVPVFEPSKSNSKLSVNSEKCIMNITLANHSFPHTIDCGGVTYYSENRQYPDQVFRYENGALIMAQGENSQMKRKPSFDIQKTDNENYAITIDAINLTGETASLSSSTLTALRLTGDSINPILNSSTDYLNESINSFNLSICTHYTDAWATYLNDTAKEAGLVYNTDYKIIYPGIGCVCLSFLPTGNNYSIYINKTIIGAELETGSGMDIEKTSGSEPDEDEDESIMKLNRWYTFQVSDNETSIVLLEDNQTGVNISIDTSSNDEVLVGYSPENAYSHNLKNNPYCEIFRFDTYTKFESTVSKVTIRMIYRAEENPLTGRLAVSGNSFDKLEPENYNQQNWYLFNETKNVYVNHPSELNFSINIDQTSGNKQFYIDYLAVYLS